MTKNDSAVKPCKQITIEAVRGNHVTLICYEKDEKSCHRRIIRKLCEGQLSKLYVSKSIPSNNS
jgi:hypothetical protein